jgi:fumarylpyruvate hydrolase
MINALPVRGERAAYPVNRIFCVRRNYVEHAKEMGIPVDREKPFFFLKSVAHIRHTGATIHYPSGTANFHYEVELVAAIGRRVFNGDLK